MVTDDEWTISVIWLVLICSTCCTRCQQQKRAYNWNSHYDIFRNHLHIMFLCNNRDGLFLPYMISSILCYQNWYTWKYWAAHWIDDIRIEIIIRQYVPAELKHESTLCPLIKRHYSINLFQYVFLMRRNYSLHDIYTYIWQCRFLEILRISKAFNEQTNIDERCTLLAGYTAVHFNYRPIQPYN